MSRAARRWCTCIRSYSTAPDPPITRLSSVFVPSYSEAPSTGSDARVTSGHDYLVRAGFLRQSSAGVFTFLPLGLRVLAKLERIIDEEMQRIGGQKLSLPTLLPVDAWEKSGRLASTGAEMFQLQDRKKSKFVLAPTHEEEITQLVASSVSSHRQLPLRLYQIGRKHRDELRPRGGLLRGRELLMKDLYTFDLGEVAALQTYDHVCDAYNRVFTRIGVPFTTAEADTGNIGGTRSHEYHYASEAGEDTVLACGSCGYAANVERARSIPIEAIPNPSNTTGVNQNVLPKDSQFLSKLTDLHVCADASYKNVVLVLLRPGDKPNSIKIKKHPKLHKSLILLERLLPNQIEELVTKAENVVIAVDSAVLPKLPDDSSMILDDFREAEHGEGCPSCKTNKLKGHKAIEVGHTFYLGTRYSVPLNATFRSSQNKDEHFVMGCYGIGVSRVIGAVSEICKDDQGLVWPDALAPYTACIVPSVPDLLSEPIARRVIELVAQRMPNDVILDDRGNSVARFGYKMKDAALVGYPYVIVLGKKLEQEGLVEVHERATGIKHMVIFDHIVKGLEKIMKSRGLEYQTSKSGEAVRQIGDQPS
ncbi:proline---tRNA ligase [Synchytrium microbalum]|uniref:Probable proline--tRNA ligase, mitochondrial n=1 Tax=Synchytrium microbalum TaxID=1806994 RepID=A0A507C6Z0_9FUNG|nr:proline---tRNA ligase [Synchytrium microbalum]TPX33303.1 proline---tRNA ligase [Synchytrium microbalum]